EEPAAELVGHPVLEAPGVGDREPAGLEVRQHAAGRLDDAELAQRLAGLERVGEELAAVIDARGPRPLEHVVGEDLGPEVFHLLPLGEEAVAADVEVEPLVAGRAGDAADVGRVGLQDGHLDALLTKEVGGGEPGGPGPDDRDRLVTHGPTLRTYKETYY